MNAPRLALVGSLALNAILAVGLLFSTSSPPESELGATPGPALDPPVPAAETLPTPVLPPPPNPEPAPPAASASLDWTRDFEAADLQQLIANLRHISCPEETIRDIIVSRVNRKYAEQISVLAGQESLAGNSGDGSEAATARYEQQVALLQEQQTAELNSLLGSEWPRPFLDDPPAQDPRATALTFLPEEKRGAVEELQARYDQQESDIRRNFTSGNVEVALAALAQQKEADLKRLLTPAEFEDYDVVVSPTAQWLREELSGFGATEKEFRTIFRLREQFGGEGQEHILRAELRRVLGDARYSELVAESSDLAGLSASDRDQ